MNSPRSQMACPNVCVYVREKERKKEKEREREREKEGRKREITREYKRERWSASQWICLDRRWPIYACVYMCM